jgi:hypothetical protein
MPANDQITGLLNQITGLLDEVAAHREHVTRLDARETEHHAAASGQFAGLTSQVTGVTRMLEDHEAALAQLTGTAADTGGQDGYQPGPAPGWWKLPPGGRAEHIARLRAWVEQVYRPGYGHLAAALAPCWETHDLCLYGLDILSTLWSVLYLPPDRTPGLLSAQAEYQARLLPALADQLRAETTSCGHRPAPAAPPWTRP